MMITTDFSEHVKILMTKVTRKKLLENEEYIQFKGQSLHLADEKLQI